MRLLVVLLLLCLLHGYFSQTTLVSGYDNVTSKTVKLSNETHEKQVAVVSRRGGGGGHGGGGRSNHGGGGLGRRSRGGPNRNIPIYAGGGAAAGAAAAAAHGHRKHSGGALDYKGMGHIAYVVVGFVILVGIIE